MHWLYFAGIFYLGLSVGFFLKAYVEYRFQDYSGVMFVTKEEGKTVYSLMLEDYPEKLEFRKSVLFKVIHASEESSDRD